MDLQQCRTEWIRGGLRQSRAPIDRLTLDVAVLARGLGYRSSSDSVPSRQEATQGRRVVPPHVAKIAEAVLAMGRELLDPRWVWAPVTVEDDRDALICLPPFAGQLSVGNLVRDQLRGSQVVVAFVVTIGSRLEEQARAMIDAGQSPEGYTLDTVGSMAVEACADVLEAELAEAATGLGWGITNRFSPGYCTWETAGQRALFALLPDKPAGVTLNASSLMQPIKSISGVIGLGEDIEHRPYMCDFCPMKDCHQRLTASRL